MKIKMEDLFIEETEKRYLDGRKLVGAMTRRRVSFFLLSRKTNIDEGTIRSLAKNKETLVPEETIEKIAEALEMSKRALIADDDLEPIIIAKVLRKKTAPTKRKIVSKELKELIPCELNFKKGQKYKIKELTVTNTVKKEDALFENSVYAFYGTAEGYHTTHYIFKRYNPAGTVTTSIAEHILRCGQYQITEAR